MSVSSIHPVAQRTLSVAAAGLVCWSVVGQPSEGEPILLWPEGAPSALGSEPKDIPTLTPFLPRQDEATGAAMLVFPGGAYGHLAEHEGAGYARYLSEHGIAAFVLKYRLGTDGYRHPSMLQDAARAVRLVRRNAEAWKLDSHRIGVIGSSAGGHLASTILTHFDEGHPDSADPVERVSSRPDLGVLCYPVISMGDLAHAGSRKNLLGSDPEPELIELLSNETQVTSNTPPCFVWHTVEDTTVKVENSLEFAAALRRANVPFELHIYQKGGHGLGLGNRDHGGLSGLLPWVEECRRWLKLQGFAR